MRPLVLLVVAAGCASEADRGNPPPLSGPRRAITAEGEVTWTAAFDDEAQIAGLEDCTYTRRYTATEDRSTPWLCPECDVVLLAEVEMTEADRACYRSITGVEPSTQERIGWSEDRFYRTTYPFGPMVEGGSVDRTGTERERVSFAEDPAEIGLGSGFLALDSAGELSIGLATANPWQGMLPERGSSCGWPQTSLEAWSGPWEVAVGAQLPDGWFEDACGESTRLHDFFGSYLVVSVSAMDCGPCQAMAADEEAFAERVRALGVGFVPITLLAPSLEAPVDPISQADLALWAETFQLDSPVLGDRGWGYAMSRPLWPDVMSYPSWFVTSPSFEVLAAGQGYDGWEGAWEAITRHRFEQ